MRYPLIAAALAALTFMPLAGAQAQDRDTSSAPPAPPASPEPEVLPFQPYRGELMDVVMSRRARLGIKVSLQSRDTDSLGAYVDAVTPGGPADKAGIRSGDVIGKLDGQSLAGTGTGDDDRNTPGYRLIRLAARLQPNDTVAVEYLRGKEWKTVSVVTAEEPGFAFEATPHDWGRRIRMAMRRPVAGMRMDNFERRFFNSPLAHLEVAPLNPDLGQYFGTNEGVLVISVPKDSKLNLKGGDVILAVDGRKPSSPGHLMRIFRSYEEGEEFKLEVLRNRKRTTITARLDERERGRDHERGTPRDRPHR